MSHICYKGFDIEGFIDKFGCLFNDIGKDINEDTLICVYDDLKESRIDDHGIMHLDVDSFTYFTVIYVKSFKQLRKDKSLSKFFNNIYEGITGGNYESS